MTLMGVRIMFDEPSENELILFVGKNHEYYINFWNSKTSRTLDSLVLCGANLCLSSSILSIIILRGDIIES